MKKRIQKKTEKKAKSKKENTRENNMRAKVERRKVQSYVFLEISMTTLIKYAIWPQDS